MGPGKGRKKGKAKTGKKLPKMTCKETECRNGGTCNEDPHGRAVCSCLDGFTGVRCETGKARDVKNKCSQ